MSTSSRAIILLHAVPALAALASCATGEAESRLSGPGIPLAVHLTLMAPEAGIYGTAGEWTDEILGALEEWGACADAWTDWEPPGPPPDMELVVTLSSRDPLPSLRDVPGAFLEFLAWSAVPPAQLWIPDVLVDPGLEVQVRACKVKKRRSSPCFPPYEEGKEILLGEGDARCPPLMTSHLDRNAFFSWRTLASVAVPPFAFKEPDREHLAGAIAGDVRRNVAERIAKKVKEAGWSGDGLEALKISNRGGVRALQYQVDPDRIGFVLVWIVQLRPPMRDPPIRVPIGIEQREGICPLPGLAAFEGGLRYLLIEAVPRGEDESSWFTVPLDPPGDGEVEP